MSFLNLKSSDDVIIKISIEAAKLSKTLKNMLEGCDNNRGSNGFVPLPNVISTILQKVVDYAEHHKNDPAPTAEEEEEQKKMEIPRWVTDCEEEPKPLEISPWDTNFLNVGSQTLFDLSMAANYLDIEGLLNVTTATIANMIRGKTPEEIRSALNIKNDFTEEDPACKLTEWCAQ